MPPVPQQELIDVVEEAATRLVKAATVAVPSTEVKAPWRPDSVAGVTWHAAELCHEWTWRLSHRAAAAPPEYVHPRLVDHTTAVQLLDTWARELIAELRVADEAEDVPTDGGTTTVRQATVRLACELVQGAQAVVGDVPVPLAERVAGLLLDHWIDHHAVREPAGSRNWFGQVARIGTTDTGQEWYFDLGIGGGKYGEYILRPADPASPAASAAGRAAAMFHWVTWRLDHPEVELTGHAHAGRRLRKALRHTGVEDPRTPVWLRVFGSKS